MQPEPQARSVASVIEPYATGAYDLFSHRTNIETDKRIVCFNIQKIGSGLKALGLFICTNYVWNEMLKNCKKKIYTWFYIDEFHLLLQTDNTIKTMVSIWKRARKFLGVPTGITQNTAELLRASEASGIINNTNFVIMLSLPKEDRQNYRFCLDFLIHSLIISMEMIKVVVFYIMARSQYHLKMNFLKIILFIELSVRPVIQRKLRKEKPHN